MDERPGFESFECAPALRLESHERVAALQFEALDKRIDRIEELQERLERRLWLAVYGVLATIIAQAFQGILSAVP